MGSNSESFEAWFSESLKSKMQNLPYNRDSLIRDAWNHQQANIDKLEKENEMLRECVELMRKTIQGNKYLCLQEKIRATLKAITETRKGK